MSADPISNTCVDGQMQQLLQGREKRFRDCFDALMTRFESDKAK